MGETGIIVGLPGSFSLDPRAEEFRPASASSECECECECECEWYPLPMLPFTLPLPLPLSLSPQPQPQPQPHLSSTRSLLLTPVPLLSVSLLRAQLQAFGDVRHLETDALRHGILTVHFYDLRHAQSAFSAIPSMHPISAHYVLPSSNSLPDAHNQGSLLVFNLDPHLSTHLHLHLRPLFRPFGPIKQFRDTPWKHTQRFVEFFDIRHAANALKHLNGKHFHGKPLLIQFSSPSHPSPHTRTPKPQLRHWKGKQPKKHETRFLIKEVAPTDTRTTVMIKNIPNKYSQKLLLNMLDNHCIHCNQHIPDSHHQPLSSYDFVYLPIDFNNKCNVGYGFVNMTSQEAAVRLYKAFHLQHWEVFNSRKICQVTYARVQGLEALKEHFKNSKFPCEMEHYLPVVFSPPRDGRELTEPLAIAGAGNRQHEAMLSDDDDVGGSSSGSGGGGGGALQEAE